MSVLGGWAELVRGNASGQTLRRWRDGKWGGADLQLRAQCGSLELEAVIHSGAVQSGVNRLHFSLPIEISSGYCGSCLQFHVPLGRLKVGGAHQSFLRP